MPTVLLHYNTETVYMVQKQCDESRKKQVFKLRCLQLQSMLRTCVHVSWEYTTVNSTRPHTWKV